MLNSELDRAKRKAEIFQEFQDDVAKWAIETFGMYRTAKEPAHHLKKEVDELINALSTYYQGNYSQELFTANIQNVKEELADCFILIGNIAERLGLNMHQLLEASVMKMVKNKKRTWGNPDANGVVEHNREL
jgi:NTP pyrophosphatase (non-canonical NTP hydrolase)